MTATITKTRAFKNDAMKSFFAKKRDEQVEYVDAWIITGETEQRPYEIETRVYENALKFAAAIDAEDHDTIERMLAN
jgi:hypothetical protein